MYICYSPAGRSVLGETVPEVLSNQDKGHGFFQIRTDLGSTYAFSNWLMKPCVDHGNLTTGERSFTPI